MCGKSFQEKGDNGEAKITPTAAPIAGVVSSAQRILSVQLYQVA
jgi:hypothetical protein